MSEQADSIIASYAEEGWGGKPLRKTKLITCKYCGEKGLKWTLVNEKWLLGDGITPHQCKVNPYIKRAICKK
ncbi:MAG: hypothetical protein M0R32_11095 [Candidatus Cloacimonetes bacterium]|jgi:hypothetical protein|nr:hypothetical protein [Candidatus Cloacimonadota bacterium]